MMISTFFAIVSRRKISLKQRQLIMTDMNQPKLSGIVRMIRITFTIILLCQAISGAIFLFIFILMAIMTIGGMPYFMVLPSYFRGHKLWF